MVPSYFQMKLGPQTEKTLKALRDASEDYSGDGWRSVYLDNARPSGMSDKTFRSHLATLAKAGLYRVVDGYAFGDVKMEEPA